MPRCGAETDALLRLTLHCHRPESAGLSLLLILILELERPGAARFYKLLLASPNPRTGQRHRESQGCCASPRRQPFFFCPCFWNSRRAAGLCRSRHHLPLYTRRPPLAGCHTLTLAALLALLRGLPCFNLCAASLVAAMSFPSQALRNLRHYFKSTLSGASGFRSVAG